MRALNRRSFLGAACAGGLATTFAPSLSFARASTDRRFVFVLLRGAMDGLHAIVPAGDPHYRAARGSLAYAANDLTRLDGMFGLAPGLSPLAASYRSGELLPVQGLAIPYRTRSHFDAQSILETGLDKPVGAASGWLNRTLDVLGGASNQGIAVGGPLPLSMQGRVPVATWAPSALRSGNEAFIDDLSQLYNLDPVLADPFTAALTLQEQAMDMDAGGTSKRGLAKFEQLFAATGRFLNAADGARIASLEFSGWDTHVGQGLANGTLDRRLNALATGLLALKSQFSADAWSKTVVVVATEFGRTVATNGSGGTDHGTGGAALLYGGAVRGGRVLADWPGLASNQLFEQRDLRPTFDTRQLLKGVLAAQFDLRAAELDRLVFPDSQGVPALAGLVR
ncbi:MAG: DUF1501 domain-containing protein [Alphaproteobacteria bacterium]|nr:DUF1501 domain-containing protein [Alphaproteobacteria bacterium]